MSNFINASISYAVVLGAGAFSGGLLSFTFCKTKMKEMVVVGAVLNVAEKFFADLLTNCILRNPSAAANPIATAQKVLAVRLGGLFLCITLLIVAAVLYKRQENQAKANNSLV